MSEQKIISDAEKIVNKMTLTDGPHGLRKQVKAPDKPGMNESLPATCFPTAGALACCFF